MDDTYTKIGTKANTEIFVVCYMACIRKSFWQFLYTFNKQFKHFYWCQLKSHGELHVYLYVLYIYEYVYVLLKLYKAAITRQEPLQSKEF